MDQATVSTGEIRLGGLALVAALAVAASLWSWILCREGWRMARGPIAWKRPRLKSMTW